MKKINLIIVEDSADDVYLLLRNLKKSGFNVNYECVGTESEMRDSLDKREWDIIISDHALQRFSSTKALEILKEMNIDIPLLILSGNISKDVAMEAMRNGAKDCIMKDDATRLIPAIERELRESELRKDKLLEEEEIKHLAYHDGLTGLINRLEFERRLKSAIESACKENKTHSLLYMDLDYFKTINDSCGHLAGDELLRQLTSKLLLSIRSRDTLARVGGDEFCLLLDNCRVKRAVEIAHDIIDSVRNFSFKWDDKVFKIGISIGVIEIDSNSPSPGSLLSSVDDACYQAKDRGRNTVVVHEEKRKESKKHQNYIDWSRRLDNALNSDSFSLYHQLIVPLQKPENGDYHEILVRLKNENNLILPSVFIPEAERYYRMSAIDNWVIKNSFKNLKEIQESNPKENKPYFISINLSGQSITNPGLYEYIKGLIDEYKLDAGNICFEITETATIENFQLAMEFFSKIKSLGCKLSLDDFGSGFNSFAYLKSIHVDYVKIDGSIVKNILRDPINQEIVRSIHSISNKCGAKTIAEFVESDEIKKIITDIGVDYAQGFAIHRPELLT